MNKVIIQGNKIKVFEAFKDNDQINILMILLIVKYSTSGKTLSVPLKKISFILDAVKKNNKVNKLSVLLSSPWEINDSLRKNIILAHEKGLLFLKDSGGSLGVGIDGQGTKVTTEIESLGLIPEIRKDIAEWCKAVSVAELKKQNLIW